VINPATGESTTTITKESRFERGFLVSAQAGWTLAPLDVRVGQFDSTGGGAIDYRLNHRIRLTGEAFDFSKRRDSNPHVRLYGEYIFRQEKPNTPLLFISSGVDNVLNNTAFTFGGGIRWRFNPKADPTFDYADTKLDNLATPIAKAQIAAALALLGDRVRAERVYAAALASIVPPHS